MVAAKNTSKNTAQAAQAAPQSAPEAKAEQSAPALDFGALEVTDAPAEALKRTRTTKLDTSPVLTWLRDSFENDKGKAVKVPTANAKELMTLLRSGAERLKIGVSINPKDNGDGTTTVTFLGKPRRSYKGRAKTA